MGPIGPQWALQISANQCQKIWKSCRFQNDDIAKNIDKTRANHSILLQTASVEKPVQQVVLKCMCLLWCALWCAVICNDLHVFYSVFWSSEGFDLQWFAGCKSVQISVPKSIEKHDFDLQWFAADLQLICSWFAHEFWVRCLIFCICSVGAAAE